MAHTQRQRDGARRRASEPCDSTHRTFPRAGDPLSGLLPSRDEEHHAVAPATTNVPLASSAARAHQGECTRASSPGAGVRTDWCAPRGIRHPKRLLPAHRTPGASSRSPRLSPRRSSRAATAKSHPSLLLDGRGLVDIPSFFGEDVGAGGFRDDPRGGDRGLKADAAPPPFYPLGAGMPASREQGRTATSAGRGRPKGSWDRESIRAGRRSREAGHDRPAVSATAPGCSGAGAPPKKPNNTVEEAGVAYSEEAGKLGQLAAGDSHPAQACTAGVTRCVDGEWAEEIKIKDEQIRVLKQQLAALGEHPMEEVVTLDVGMLALLCCCCCCRC